MQSRSDIRQRLIVQLLLLGFTIGAAACSSPNIGDPGYGGAKGNCVSQDNTIVRQRVTQEQCADICPTCSWQAA